MWQRVLWVWRCEQFRSGQCPARQQSHQDSTRLSTTVVQCRTAHSSLVLAGSPSGARAFTAARVLTTVLTSVQLHRRTRAVLVQGHTDCQLQQQTCSLPVRQPDAGQDSCILLLDFLILDPVVACLMRPCSKAHTYGRCQPANEGLACLQKPLQATNGRHKVHAQVDGTNGIGYN